MRKGRETRDCLAWTRLRGDLIHAYKYLIFESQVDWARLFSMVPSDGIMGNGH